MKILKSQLRRIIKEEHTKLLNEARNPYFNDYGYQERDYPGYKEMERRERGGMGYDEPEEREPMSARMPAPKAAMAATKPAPETVSPKVSMAREFVSGYSRADRADALPGNFFDARKDRIEILNRARRVAAGDESVPLTPEELEGFYQMKR